jgi:hypothetical protein
MGKRHGLSEIVHATTVRVPGVAMACPAIWEAKVTMRMLQKAPSDDRLFSTVSTNAGNKHGLSIDDQVAGTMVLTA